MEWNHPAGNYRWPSDPVPLFPPEVPQYQYQKLPLITGCSRENDYNPTRVYISGHIKEQFDPHPEVDAIVARVYSDDNIKRLQDMIRANGLGEAKPWELKPFIDYQMRFDRGIYPGPGCPLSRAQVQQMRNEAAEAVNARVVQMVRSNMQATKFGYEQYYKDIQFHRFPEYQRMEPVWASNRRSDDSLEFPYYHTLQ